MSDAQSPFEPEAPDRPPEPSGDDPLGLATLVVGVIAISSAMVFGIGALLGAFGVLLGLGAMARNDRPKKLAAVGTALSALAIPLGAAVVGAMYYGFTKLDDFVLGQTGNFEDWVGVTAPPLKLTLDDESTFNLEDHLGQKVVLYVEPIYVDWGARGNDGVLNDLADTQAGEFTVIGLVLAPEEFAGYEISDSNFEFPFAYSEDVDEPYSEAEYGPITFVIDRQGTIQHIFYGSLDPSSLAAVATGPDYAGEVRDAPEPTPTTIESP